MSADGETRTIRTEALARVEGEGAMQVKIRGGEVENVELQIYEPPRFFEAFLRGRDFKEAPDITARICGICPVAYMTSAFNAMEEALDVEVSDGIRVLRRLMYCGEWIESHALHVFLLHAPDFLGFESAWAMARDHREVVERGLKIKAMGNDLLRTIGGRAIHPINVRVGGFYKSPSRADLDALVPGLEEARELARQSVAFVAGLDFPDFEQDYEFVALRHPDHYAIEDGRLVSGS
jgi:sulfhydrogenase subunit alpha